MKKTGFDDMNKRNKDGFKGTSGGEGAHTNVEDGNYTHGSFTNRGQKPGDNKEPIQSIGEVEQPKEPVTLRDDQEKESAAQKNKKNIPSRSFPEGQGQR